MVIDTSVVSWIYDIEHFITILLMTYVRVSCMVLVMPILKAGGAPKLVRVSVFMMISLFAYPLNDHLVLNSYVMGVEIVVKEAFVGFLLGFVMCIPFFVFEGMGFIIDNQRGGSSAALTSIISGDESSPMGELLLVISILFFCYSGGVEIMLAFFYKSYIVWPIDVFVSIDTLDNIVLFTPEILAMMLYFMGLVAAPFIFSMLLTELSLGLVSKFAPQLNVFFLSMPIKSVVVFCALFLISEFLNGIYGKILDGAYEIGHELFTLIELSRGLS